MYVKVLSVAPELKVFRITCGIFDEKDVQVRQMSKNIKSPDEADIAAAVQEFADEYKAVLALASQPQAVKLSKDFRLQIDTPSEE